MPEQTEIPQPTELINPPRPSWAPALLAFGSLMVVNGIYGEGWLVRGWVYLIAGAVIALVALRSLVSGAVRDFYRLPREQRIRSAVLPAASVKPPEKR